MLISANFPAATILGLVFEYFKYGFHKSVAPTIGLFLRDLSEHDQNDVVFKIEHRKS
jgi:hypothetical protein